MTEEARSGRELPRPRRLRTAAARRAVLAPDLERYLARRSVDLTVTDQLEALQVRVRRGVEVLARKIEEGIRITGRAAAVLGTLVALCLIAANAFFLELWARAAFLAAAGMAGTFFVRAVLDWDHLRGLRGRYTGGVEQARTAEDLLAFAERVLENARALGAVPDNQGQRSGGR